MSTISPHTTTLLCTHWNLYFLWSILVQDIAVMHGLVYRTINPVPLKKTEYNCNYTSELHRHLSEENLNAKYPSPHPTIEINIKCYILHYNTSMLANVHWKRSIFLYSVFQEPDLFSPSCDWFLYCHCSYFIHCFLRYLPK